MAGTTGLEPATSAVTGQHSNQLNYVPWKTLPTALHLPVSLLARSYANRETVTIPYLDCSKQSRMWATAESGEFCVATEFYCASAMAPALSRRRTTQSRPRAVITANRLGATA
jgi:hypothetical protein